MTISKTKQINKFAILHNADVDYDECNDYEIFLKFL